jgi:hypothetical protein
MKPDKAALKALREERKALIQGARENSKARNKLMKQIREQLASGEKTVPEIAAATKIPPPQVLWCVATLRKFGEIVEGEEDGGYFRYAMAAAAEKEEA